MPIYEYRCEACAAEYEKITRMGTRDEEIACPLCGERRSHKMVSSIAARTGEGGGGANCGPTGFS